MPEVRWRESFTLTLDGMLTPGRERLVIVFGYCAQSFVLVHSEPTNVHSFLKKRERGGPHPVLQHAECYLNDGWVCDCHYYGVGKAAPPDSD